MNNNDWKTLAAVMYQAAGAYDMPEQILDLLSAAQSGDDFNHLLDILPVNPPDATGSDRKPVYQVRVNDGSPDAKEWVEVSEQEFHTPLHTPSLWDKRILYAEPFIKPPAMDAACLDEARHCAFVLDQIGSLDQNDIDDDTIELRFELDDVDTGASASVTEYAARASAVISRLLTIISCWESDLATPSLTSSTEMHSDDICFDIFAQACKTKLAKSRAKGRGGWDNPEACRVETLANMLVEHLLKGNAGTFEDIATFAMMLHQRGADPKVLADAAKGERFTHAEREAVARALNTPGWSEKLVATLNRTIDHLQKGYSTDIAREHVLNDVTRGRALLMDAITPLKSEYDFSPLAYAYRELKPQFMRNHLRVFERYGIVPKEDSVVIHALRIALDGVTRRNAGISCELNPALAEFYIAEQNEAGRFELSEDCMCAIALLLDTGLTLPDTLRAHCDKILADQHSAEVQALAQLVLTSVHSSHVSKPGENLP